MVIRRALFSAVALLSCWGCEGSLLPVPPVTPDQEQADALASALDNHTQDLLVAFNIQEFLLFELPLKALAMDPSTPGPRLASCPILDDDTDADGDGIPDNATFTFSGADCTRYVDPVGTFVQSGIIRIVDRGEAPGYHLTFEQFRVHATVLGSFDYTTITVDGTYDVTATTRSATLLESVVVHTAESVGGVLVNTLATYDLEAVFTATGRDEVDLSIPLPTGVLSVSGNTTWQSGRASFAHRVSTARELTYDSTCPDGPEFLSGRIDAAQTNAEGVFVFLRYTGCGVDPIIQRTNGN